MLGGNKPKIRKGYKYNSAERQKAREIYDLKNKQQQCFNRYQDLDVKINLLKSELNGKYC